MKVSSMSGKRELVSIIIPVFNEEDGIRLLQQKLLCLKDLLSDQYDLEFIFVDDGSSDGTVAGLKNQFAIVGTDIRILEHGVNRGVGAAFRTGFGKAQGDFVCSIDSDCTYSPEGLKLLLNALTLTGTDIAVASPYHPQGGVEGVPSWRLLLSKGCSAMYRRVAPLKLYTYTSIFRAYRRKVVRTVCFKSNGFVSAVEILMAAGRKGFTVTEVPMVLRARSTGRSKMKVARTILSHLKMLFGFVLSPQAVVHLSQPPRPVDTFANALSHRDSKDPFAA